MPDLFVWAQPGLCQQLGGGDSRLVDVAVPKLSGQNDTVGQVARGAPLGHQFVDPAIADTQIASLGLVIGGHFAGLVVIGQRLE